MTNCLSARFFCFLFLPSILSGCLSSIHWVQEHRQPPSCIPDSPPLWDKYTEQEWESPHSAQTAVQFSILSRHPPRLQARLDTAHSWVKPHIVNRWYPYDRELGHRLLRHEQLHFAISCLLTRQANATLNSEDDLDRMLFLLRATAQRLNLQYDRDTNHGTIPIHQTRWETDVAHQLQSLH